MTYSIYSHGNFLSFAGKVIERSEGAKLCTERWRSISIRAQVCKVCIAILCALKADKLGEERHLGVYRALHNVGEGDINEAPTILTI